MESSPPPPMETSKRRAAATASIASLTNDNSVLPIELIFFEILIRLPVKTLLKMRSVSKSWISRISTPEFVKAHLNFSANNREFAHHRVLSIRSGSHIHDDGHITRWRYFRTFSLYAILYGESPCFPVELHNFGVSYNVLGSCDGLFVISKTWYDNDIENLFLWNPSIRRLSKLPYSGIDVRKRRFAYGFGYIKCQNDYQIVEIVASKPSYLIADISVYSLRNNSWKTIQEFPSISLPENVKFVKGQVHWITGGGSGNNATWFNPGDEKFGNVALPIPSGDTFNWKLVSSSGNLCMTCDYRNKTDVWIMKEYGLAESWTIVGSIPKFVNKVVRPIFISRNDEILLQDVSGLVWWYVSRDDGSFDRPEDQTRCEYDRGSELNLYIESLVSPSSP